MLLIKINRHGKSDGCKNKKNSLKFHSFNDDLLSQERRLNFIVIKISFNLKLSRFQVTVNLLIIFM